jgi:hypothetical protein
MMLFNERSWELIGNGFFIKMWSRGNCPKRPIFYVKIGMFLIRLRAKEIGAGLY